MRKVQLLVDNVKDCCTCIAVRGEMGGVVSRDHGRDGERCRVGWKPSMLSDLLGRKWGTKNQQTAERD